MCRVRTKSFEDCVTTSRDHIERAVMITGSETSKCSLDSTLSVAPHGGHYLAMFPLKCALTRWNGSLSDSMHLLCPMKGRTHTHVHHHYRYISDLVCVWLYQYGGSVIYHCGMCSTIKSIRIEISVRFSSLYLVQIHDAAFTRCLSSVVGLTEQCSAKVTIRTDSNRNVSAARLVN